MGVQKPGASKGLVLNIIWANMVSAIGVYWLLLLLIARTDEHRVASPRFVQFFCLAFLFLSAADLGVAWFWHRWTTAQVDERLRAGFHLLSDNERSALSQQLFTSAIVTMALLEAVACFGLVVGLFSRPDPTPFYLFAITSLLGLLLFRLKVFPTIFEWLGRIERRSSPARL